MRVREMLERSRRSVLDGQGWEGSARQLLQRSKETVAQFVGSSVPRENTSQDALAGVCSSIALRDLNLVESLLEQLEKMEAAEDDPESLAQLYALDHLATRLRRNAESLRVLAGREAGTGSNETSSMVDVIRAAMSAIEHYQRVELGNVAGLGVVGFAADDVSRLVAELLDNATLHSPPSSTVTVSAHLTEQGSVMVRVEDSGIGMPPARISALNERLGSAPVLDRQSVQHMGLAVVRRLAHRHGVRVWLARRAPHGTVASVLLPPALVHEAPKAPWAANTRAPTSTTSTAPVRPSAPPPPDWSKPVPQSGSDRPVEATARPGFVDPASVQSGDGDTTANGLPRRVPMSLKESAVTWPPAPAEEAPLRGEQERKESHEQLLADLGAFAEGEQAAQQEKEANPDKKTTDEGRDT